MRSATRFAAVLAAVAADPAARLRRVGVLGEAERAQVLYGWNDTAVSVPSGTLPGLFEAQAAGTPDAVAVCCAGAWVSYGELDARANRLARRAGGGGGGAGAGGGGGAGAVGRSWWWRCWGC